MSISIVNGKSALVEASFKDSQGNSCKPTSAVTWSSSNTGIVTIQPSGNAAREFYDRAVIMAVSTGTANIVASSEDGHGNVITATLQVVTYDGLPTSIEVRAYEL